MTLITPSAVHPSPPTRKAGGAMGRLSTPKPPRGSLHSAVVACDALSCGDVARRHPRDPRRCVREPRGACAGCRARRAPRVVSHMPGQTRRTTSLAMQRHRSLREAVPPASMAAPASRSTLRMGSFVQRVLDGHTSCSKEACGEADVPQVPPLSCAGDRHGILPHAESPRAQLSLSCSSRCVQDGCLVNSIFMGRGAPWEHESSVAIFM